MNHDAFFAGVRSSLIDGSLSQAAVGGINVILPALQQWGHGDVRKLAHVLRPRITRLIAADAFELGKTYCLDITPAD